MSPTITQGYAPGCIGRITELHAAYYSGASGFGVAFEAKVARELAGFCSSYQPQRDGLWLASHGGAIEGSVALDGSQAAGDGAHLRWFITSEAVRGQGLGHALLGAALAFADTCGYPRTCLWTFEGLDAARHLYEKHGFALSRQSPGSQWGKIVNEQCFVRERNAT